MLIEWAGCVIAGDQGEDGAMLIEWAGCVIAGDQGEDGAV